LRPASQIRSRGFVRLLAGTLLVAALSCERGESPPDPLALTEDERFLVEAYVEVRGAETYLRQQPAVAESLFTRLEGTIDTLRVSNAIATVGRNPERWAVVFDEIEKRLREAPPAADSSKTHNP